MRLSDSEWTVMQALWGSGPRAAREVHEHVVGETAWSYSTTRTLLARLAEKAAVVEARCGNQLVYEASVSRDDARRSAVRSLVDKAFGGAFASLVQHMAAGEELSPKERAELVRLLAETPPAKRRRGGRKR